MRRDMQIRSISFRPLESEAHPGLAHSAAAMMLPLMVLFCPRW
jgi:hypothetical protein